MSSNLINLSIGIVAEDLVDFSETHTKEEFEQLKSFLINILERQKTIKRRNTILLIEGSRSYQLTKEHLHKEAAKVRFIDDFCKSTECFGSEFAGAARSYLENTLSGA